MEHKKIVIKNYKIKKFLPILYIWLLILNKYIYKLFMLIIYLFVPKNMAICDASRYSSQGLSIYQKYGVTITICFYLALLILLTLKLYKLKYSIKQILLFYLILIGIGYLLFNFFQQTKNIGGATHCSEAIEKETADGKEIYYYNVDGILCPISCHFDDSKEILN